MKGYTTQLTLKITTLSNDYYAKKKVYHLLSLYNEKADNKLTFNRKKKKNFSKKSIFF